MLKRSHEQMLHVGLLKGAMFELKRQEVLQRQRHVAVSAVSVCAGCQRRVGRGQGVITPASDVWHEPCYNRDVRARGEAV